MAVFWLVLAGVVFGGFVFMHAPITAVCDALVQRIGFATYERIAIGTTIALAVVSAAVLRHRRTGVTSVTGPFLLMLAGLAVAAQPALVLINIENIHFVQYALLAVLLCRAGLMPESAWLATTTLGVVDETYQFLFLTFGRPDRLDWNDIVFNAVGAAFGVAIAIHRSGERPRALRHSWQAIAAALAPFVSAALYLAPPVLSPFYSVTPHGLRSHELRASEGLILVGLLWMGINELVRRASQRASVARPSPHVLGVS